MWIFSGRRLLDFPCSALVVSTVDTCFLQFTEAFVLGSYDRFRREQDLDLVLRSCGQRHWYAWAGFAGVDALRAMFPSFVSVFSALLGLQWYMLCVSLRSGRISCFST